MKPLKKTFFIIALVVVFSMASFSRASWVNNSLEELEAAKGNIQLSLLRVWGDDDTDDENQFFRFPGDILVGSDGCVYILDTGNHRIQVFDQKANFKRTIGRRGQGPGDLFDPRIFDIDDDNSLVVADCGNLRIEIFNPSGLYSKSFKIIDGNPSAMKINGKKEIVVNSAEKTFRTRKAFFIYDYQGKLLREMGTIPPKAKGETIFNTNPILFTLDEKDNLYVSYRGVPYYRKLSPQGEPLKTVVYESPLKESPTVSAPSNPEGEPVVKGKIRELVCPTMAIDSLERIYLVLACRTPSKGETFFLTGGDGAMERIPKKIPSENTNRFRLAVFDKTGKVAASAQLDVFCDKIYVYKDNLFIVDTYMGMKIYQYRISYK